MKSYFPLVNGIQEPQNFVVRKSQENLLVHWEQLPKKKEKKKSFFYLRRLEKEKKKEAYHSKPKVAVIFGNVKKSQIQSLVDQKVSFPAFKKKEQNVKRLKHQIHYASIKTDSHPHSLFHQVKKNTPIESLCHLGYSMYGEFIWQASNLKNFKKQSTQKK